VDRRYVHLEYMIKAQAKDEDAKYEPHFHLAELNVATTSNGLIGSPLPDLTLAEAHLMHLVDDVCQSLLSLLRRFDPLTG
jgi:hypothetical protein